MEWLSFRLRCVEPASVRLRSLCEVSRWTGLMLAAWLIGNRCSIHVVPRPPPPHHLLPPGAETLSDMRAQTLFTLLLDLYMFSFCLCVSLCPSHSLCLTLLFLPFCTLFSVHLSHYVLAISSGVENEVLISLLINLPSPEVPESLSVSQNDDWHFYLFGEISVGAKLNFNGSRIPPVKGAIHYWMIVMLFVASVDLWYV